VHFTKHNGDPICTVEANEGDDLVDVAQEYDLDIEAACEKSLACSTCHVIMDPDIYDQLEEPSDDENGPHPSYAALWDSDGLERYAGLGLWAARYVSRVLSECVPSHGASQISTGLPSQAGQVHGWHDRQASVSNAECTSGR
jgi:ferredoxin